MLDILANDLNSDRGVTLLAGVVSAVGVRASGPGDTSQGSVPCVTVHSAVWSFDFFREELQGLNPGTFSVVLVSFTARLDDDST